MIFAAGIASPTVSYIDLGPVRIHFYALFILLGIVAAVILTGRRLERTNIPRHAALDGALWAVPFGIVGGRTYHVITHPEDYFYPGANLLKTLYVWEGGIAIFGGILFGAAGLWIGCRRSGISFVTFVDALAPGLLLAQAIGRVGNYFNQELFGTATTLPWGLNIAVSNPAYPPGAPPGTLFHPLFLYELIWNVIGAAVIIAVERRLAFTPAASLGTYLLWYGSGRTWFEYLRLDPSEAIIAGIKVNMATALIVAIIGASILGIAIVRARRAPTYKATPQSPAADTVAGPAT